ncbi:protein of unknown function (plasmid) [Cupriavidus neocaledonicus]|uniref:Uncharacterized protein n=1 Tax=Cupriavidus neocaledonicus TaxID=1040979 RepID=A0A375HMA0_9BURK|nr:hypothetical protein CBM2605_B130284 [Cupriavidus neocaledonicus]SPD59344.1 protein of unknown function [Cupriavidus neocaledonicus]SPD59369.1 protein of unknown function [Cupriavidus neocaledonicus]
MHNDSYYSRLTFKLKATRFSEVAAHAQKATCRTAVSYRPHGGTRCRQLERADPARGVLWRHPL